jgi:hypothetical protein
MQVAQAIADLREQIIAARVEGVEKDVKFTVRTVELEMQLVLTTEGSFEGKLGWGVLSLGGGAKASDALTHKLKLTLDVTSAKSGAPPQISDRGPTGDGPPKFGG